MQSQEEKQRDFDITHMFQKVKSKITGKPPGHAKQQSKEPREIFIMNHSANSHFGYYGNYISTTKYNFATFYLNFYLNNLASMLICFSYLLPLSNKFLMCHQQTDIPLLVP